MGKASNLKKRVSSYFSNRAYEGKTLRLVSQIKFVDHIVVGSEIEAFLLESNLIKKYKPFYNVKLTDDKSYPYLEINKKPVPSVVLARRIANPHVNGRGKDVIYLGPYTNVSDLKNVLRTLRRIFPFQSVKKHPPKRCLYNHIGLCPCVQVYPEKLPEYKSNIRNLISFLKGNKNKVITNLLKEQKEYIRKEEFEKAGEIQRKIEKIGLITSPTYNLFKYEERPDYYFERIRVEISSLKEILEKHGLLVNALHRIECYDVSNIQGKNAAGSMVVFIEGDSAKSNYRRFRIRFKKTPDDYEMIREVIRRRAGKIEWQMPDLIVIDGGRGQVSAALQVIRELNYKAPVIGLAKREETIIIPVQINNRPRSLSDRNADFDFLEIRLPKSTPGVNLLRRIRDESHRFAITYHRLLRRKALIG